MAPTASMTPPLLSPVEKEMPNEERPSTNEQELQFYDPESVLSVSRDVAFGYLILMTGGAVEYEPPALEQVTSAQQQQNNSSQPTQSSTPRLDDESASLAYAAIVDGNVLHACFGLKATASGRVSNGAIPTIGGKGHSYSIFCCFPASPATLDALQLVLPQVTKNKLRMQNLIEILREVQDLQYDGLGPGAAAAGAVDTSKVPLNVQVIQAYVHLFTAVVRYHDTKKFVKSDASKVAPQTKTDEDGIICCCTNILNSMKKRIFSKQKSNPQLEKLQQDTLKDIENGFCGLREDIWESLERMATQTAFTGVSMEE